MTEVITVTLFADTRAFRKEELHLTLGALRDLIAATSAPAKAALPLLKLARFGDSRNDKSCLRHDANVLAVCGVEIDYDGEVMPFDAAVDCLRAAHLRGVIYTTPSHTAAKPRWRLLLPTSVELRPEARRELVDRANGIINGVAARESWALSQSYYFGSVNGSPLQIAMLDGDPIDARADLKPAPAGKRGTDQPRTTLGSKPHDASRSGKAWRVGHRAQRAGRSYDEFVEELRSDPETAEWLRAKGLANDERELKRIWEKASQGLDPSDPLAIARDFAQACGDGPMLHSGGTFYRWEGSRYAELADGDVAAAMYDFLEPAQRRTRDGTAPFKPERRIVESVIHALRAAVHVTSSVTPPAWLDRRADDGPLIACRNGLLRLSDGALLPHSPEYFNTSAVEFDYDPGAPAPAEWLKFLASLWPDDPQPAATLQEIFGYVIAGERKFHKMFMVVGPKRSGKGTIGRILARLVGENSHVGMALASLASNFGLAPTIGKPLVIVPDARLHGPSHEIVERLLAITGGDTLTVDRKHRDAWTGTLPARFLFLSNEVPALADASGALASRFVMLKLTASFFGREDLDLENRLAREMAGILNWSITGWRTLARRGRFEEPRSSADTRDQFDALSSPIDAFVKDRCDFGAAHSVITNELYAAWVRWCEANGRHHSNEASFGRDLRAARPNVVRKQVRVAGTLIRVYQGLKLREAERHPHPDWAAQAAEGGSPEEFERHRPPVGV